MAGEAIGWLVLRARLSGRLRYADTAEDGTRRAAGATGSPANEGDTTATRRTAAR